MPAHFNNVVEWSDVNIMNIKFIKTKEMLLGSINKDAPPNMLRAILNGVVILISFILKRHLDYTFWNHWSERRLVLMTCYTKSVIRPVLEYACPVWHNSLTTEQSDRIETIQKRTLKVISG